jgi:UDP-GlcNAc:undecaprenyl-phosphate GlcNAc-1-phosphate transferase
MIATLCFLKGGLHLKENFFLNNYWNIPISYFWILSVVNSFNLVDIMDGLATTLATWCAVGFIVIALILNQGTTLVLLLAFLGSLLGFLWYNYPPAKIYLGDAGSLFIGGFLAVIPFLFNWGVYSWYGYLAPMVILGIPLLEVSSLVVIRFYKKIPFYQGSPDHFALYLKSNGWSVKNILIYVSVVSGILILTALALFLHIISIVSFIMIALLYLILWVVVLMNLSKNILKLPLFASKH